MKIGFQGWFLQQPYTGIGQHCAGLLRALAKEKNVECIIATPSTLKPKSWLLHPSLKKWFWERVQVPAYFAKQKLDWEYYPYPCPLPEYSAHFRAVTVHDLILWKDPRYQGNKLKTLYHRLSRHSLVYADHVFTVSKSTHDELGIPAATVLPNAIPKLPKKLQKLPYNNALVYLGGYDIRKNVPRLVEAFAALKKDHPKMKLLLIGEPHHVSRYYPEIPEVPGVKKLGALSDERVYAALKSAFAFVHFSDAEGFNIPLLQAMTVGTPAIVTDLPANREISAGTALFLGPFKKNALSDSVDLLKDPKKRRAIVAAQKKAARRYSWKNTAKLFLKALNHGT